METPPVGENAGAEVKTGEEPEKGLEDEINTLDKKIKNEIAKNIGTEVQNVQKGGRRNKTKKKGNLKHRRKTPKRQPKKTKKKLRK